jgi:hypothetical protein
LFAAPTTDAPGGEEQEQQEMEGHELLDPLTSERRYWRDPLTGTQREIWRPGMLFASTALKCTKADTYTGDGDGDVEHDHFERRGPLAPLDKRWRLYQVSHLPHSTLTYLPSPPNPGNWTQSHSLHLTDIANSHLDPSSSASTSLLAMSS